jgi:hypothetical protein
VILRTITENDIVRNVLGIIQATTSDQTLVTRTLPAFNRASLSSNGENALLVTETPSGSRIELMSFGSSVTTSLLLNSPLSSWAPLIGGNGVFLQTAASGEAEGFLYELEGQTLSKTVGGDVGLTAKVSPSGRYVLYGSLAVEAPYISVLDRTTGRSYDIPAITTSDKCSWFPEREPFLFCGVPTYIPDGVPDTWYMGRASFEDDVWIIDPLRGIATLVAELADVVGESVDVIHPEVKENGSHALFTNKNDSSLWVVELSAGVLP